MARYERFVCASDLHGDEQDPSAVAAFFDFCSHWRPKHRLFLGDAWDFRYLRSKATDEDKLDPRAEADFDAGADFLKRMKPTVFLCGNHDWRVRKKMEAGDAKDRILAGKLWGDMIDAIGVEPLPYNKRTGVYQFGDTKLVHGYSAGIGAVRKHALVYGKTWLGHLHTCECITVETLDGAEARCIGALCRQELGYNEAQIGTLRQAAGFLYGVIFPDGRTVSWQAQSYGGVWLFPSEMREVKCA